MSFSVVNPLNNINEQVAILKRGMRYKTVDLDGATAYTITTADLRRGFVELSNGGGAVTVTFPSYAVTVASFEPHLVKGSTFTFLISNNSGYYATLASADMTLDATLAAVHFATSAINVVIGDAANTSYVVPVSTVYI